MKTIETKTCQPDSRLLDSAAELEQICADITAHGRVAVDTEFVWERTFYPNLGIVQLALNEKEAWLLDIPALKGKLKPLGEVLADPKIEKIIHDA
jgi:ribonuclease D